MSANHILKTNFNGTPNVGLFGYATNSYCLLGSDVTASKAKEIEKVLRVPVHQMTLCGTSLIGVFAAGNDHCLLVPHIILDHERQQLDKLGINYKIIKSKVTALGNSLVVNNNGCLASPQFSADTKKLIRQALNVPLKPGTIAGLETIGSLAVLNKRVCLIHPSADDDEMKNAEELLGVECAQSTVNLGTPYLRAGILCNDHGFVVGDQSGGPEIVHIDDSLGFLAISL
ncbi:translation initiation factor IF-6 [Candidatus Woesearchaeota archaeon]|nr:translation initiation factor IF-6 [Candidatus Woesearchaeota archaeon]